MANSEGRPPLTRDELDKMFHKLEPYLRSGRPLYKACLQSGIPSSTTYAYYSDDIEFKEKVDGAMAYSSNLINNLFFGRLVTIASKSNRFQELKNKLENKEITQEVYNNDVLGLDVSAEEWAFIWRYATTSHIARDEYGLRAELTGKDGAPLVPETSTKEVAALLQEILSRGGSEDVEPGKDPGDTPVSQ